MTSTEMSSPGVVTLGASRKPSTVRVGVVVWLASEIMFFSGLFAAYFSLRTGNRPWPPADIELTTLRTGIATLVLVASSGSMHFAVRSAERADRRMAIRWLALTVAMGTVFIANQLYDYATANFHISSGVYGSIFYLMTGFHGLHVIGGLFLMLSAIFMIGGRGSRAPSGSTITAVSYYWHFVDVVWVAMYLTIYVMR